MKKLQRSIIRAIIIVSMISMVTMVSNVQGVNAEYSIEDWWDFDVRTKLSPGVTPERVKKRFEKYGREHSPLYQNMEWIFEESEKYGINAAYIVAKLIRESTWGLDSNTLKHNNFGGIGGSNSARTFESPRAGITANILILKGYVDKGVATDKTELGVPLRTIREILPPYCNVDDGCDHKAYVEHFMIMMKSFGQTPTGDVMQGSATDAEMAERVASVRDGDGKQIPIEYLYEQMGYTTGYYIGVQDKDILRNTGVTTWLYTFSEGAQKWLFRLGWILSIILFLYISVYLIVYMTVARGSYLQEFFPEKMVEKGQEVYLQGMEGTKKIVGRVLVVLTLVVFFGTGLYVYAMSMVLGGVESLLIK